MKDLLVFQQFAPQKKTKNTKMMKMLNFLVSIIDFHYDIAFSSSPTLVKSYI